MLTSFFDNSICNTFGTFIIDNIRWDLLKYKKQNLLFERYKISVSEKTTNRTIMKFDIEVPYVISDIERDYKCTMNNHEMYMILCSSRPLFTQSNDILYINDFYTDSHNNISVTENDIDEAIANHSTIYSIIPTGMIRNKNITLQQIKRQFSKDTPNHFDASLFSFIDGRGYILQVISDNIEETVNAFYRGNKDVGRRVKTAISSTLNTYLFQNKSGHDLDYRDKVILPCYHSNETEKYYNIDLIDLSTTTNANSSKIGYIKHGVKVINNMLERTSKDNYVQGTVLSSIPFINSIDAHRKAISRTITQSVQLQNPEDPVLITDVDLSNDISGTNLFTVRMDYSYKGMSTVEDSILVSKNASKKLDSIKEYHQVVNLPAESLLFEILEPVPSITDPTDKSLSKSNIAFPKQPVIGYSYKDTYNTIDAIVSKESVLNDIVKTNVIINGKNKLQIKLSYTTHIPLEEGSKLTDCYGNKTTVGLIVPNEDMPTVSINLDGIEQIVSLDIVRPRVITKRNTPAVIMEEMYSMSAIALGTIIELDNAIEVDGKIDKYTIIDAVDYHRKACNRDTYNIQIPSIESTSKTHNIVSSNIGYIRTYRLNHHPCEKISYNSKLSLNHNQLPKSSSGNYRFGDAMISWSARGATNINKYVSDICKTTAASTIINDILFIIGYKKIKSKCYEQRNGLIFDLKDIPKTAIEINDRLQSKTKEEYLFNSFRNIENIDVSNTILDSNIRTQGGYFKIPDNLNLVVDNPISNKSFLTTNINKYVYYPRYTFGIQIGDDEYIMSPSQKAFNMFIAECINWEKLTKYGNWKNQIIKCKQKCEQRLTYYVETLNKILIGKDGLLRSSAYPRVPFSLYGVLSSDYNLDLNEVSIPKKVYNKFAKDKKFAKNCSIGCQAIVTRFPAHNTCNSVAMRVKINDTNCIKVNPAILHLFDGDLDGDSVAVMFIPDPIAQKDLYKLSINHEIRKYFKPTKELLNVQPTKQAVIKHLQNIRGNSVQQLNDKISNTWESMANDNIVIASQYYNNDIQACLDYSDRKTLTAFMGSISNDVIHIADSINKSILNASLEFRHSISQIALDAKHGEQDLAKILKLAFYSIDDITTTTIEKYIDQIKDNRFSPKSRKLLISLLHKIMPQKPSAFIIHNNNRLNIGSFYSLTKKNTTTPPPYLIFGNNLLDQQLLSTIG